MHTTATMEFAVPGTRVGDYVIEARHPVRDGVFVSTHVVLPRRAHIVARAGEQAFALARLLEAIRHPTVPRIYECGQRGDLSWLAVAAIEGPTLADYLAGGPLPVEDTAALIRDVAAILAHAHGNGIVHGGIRAEHLVHASAGWQIVDWSEAEAAADHATDIEALGAVAYAALARALPTVPLAHRCPSVPLALAQLIDAMRAGELGAAEVHARATLLVETPDLEIEPDAVPISLEDIILLDVQSGPPPIPPQLRVRAQGTGPVAVGRVILEKKQKES